MNRSALNKYAIPDDIYYMDNKKSIYHYTGGLLE